jgi:hypothetical protein
MTNVGNISASGSKPHTRDETENKPNFESTLDAEHRPIMQRRTTGMVRPPIVNNIESLTKAYEKVNANNRQQVTALKQLLRSRTSSSLPRQLTPLVEKYERSMSEIIAREDGPQAPRTPQTELDFAKEKIYLTAQFYREIQNVTSRSKTPFGQQVNAAIGVKPRQSVIPR